jgi:hypothetical protein
VGVRGSPAGPGREARTPAVEHRRRRVVGAPGQPTP